MNRIYIVVLLSMLILYHAHSAEQGGIDGWSVERYGMRIKLVTDKVVYSVGENIRLKLCIKNETTAEQSPSFSPVVMNRDYAEELLNISVIRNYDNAMCPLNYKHFEKTQFINPFQRGHPGIIARKMEPGELLEHKYLQDTPLEDIFLLDKPGKYTINIFQWVRQIYGEFDLRRPIYPDPKYNMALIKADPIEFEIVEDKQGGIKNGNFKPCDIVQEIYKETPSAYRNLEIENSLQWVDGPFGLKVKAYIIPTTHDARDWRPDLEEERPLPSYLHIIVKNFSDSIVPAIEYGHYCSEELWNIRNVNVKTGAQSFTTSERGYAQIADPNEFSPSSLKAGLKEVLYYMKRINPGETVHERISVWGVSFGGSPLFFEASGTNIYENGEFLLSAKRRIYYSNDGIYNADTTEGQRELLKKLEMKELVLPPLKFEIINMPEMTLLNPDKDRGTVIENHEVRGEQ